MRLNLGEPKAIHKLKAVLGVGNLLANFARKLRQQVAMFAGSSFGVFIELTDFTVEECVLLGFKLGDIAVRVAYLAVHPGQLCLSVFACNYRVNLTVIVEQLLQHFRVAAGIGLVGPRHQQSEVLLLRFVAREIGMNAFCELAKKRFQVRRRIDDFGLAIFAKGGFMRFMGACARLFRSLAGPVGVVKSGFALGNARFQVIEFGVQLADLTEVTALKRSEQSAELCQFRLPLSKERACCRQLPAPFMQAVVRGGVDRESVWEFGWDFGRHADFLRLSFQFS
jgi:hypothetical protein